MMWVDMGRMRQDLHNSFTNCFRLQKFAATPDPDFEEAALLEQYQVEYSSLLSTL